MNIPQWTDATSYSRNKEKKQTAWQVNLGHVKIYITCAHLHSPGKFVMHCHQLGFDTHNLNIGESQVQAAKDLAIKMCYDRASMYLSQLQNILNAGTKQD